MTNKDENLEELQTIRKLMILALLRTGMTQSEIGAALGVHRTQIGRMFPKGALSKIAKSDS
jgi:DNA-binding transcriptional regulator LsrR (DeoR family)